MSSVSATPNTSELNWSKSESEEAIVRTAFDAALNRELQEVIQQAKQKANQIKEPANLGALEHCLTQRRKDIDRKYDYRYSQVTQLFGRPLYRKRLREEELHGLRDDKLKSIRSFAKFLAEDTAA